jgi:hypothetical protein
MVQPAAPPASKQTDLNLVCYYSASCRCSNGTCRLLQTQQAGKSNGKKEQPFNIQREDADLTEI